MVRNHHLRKIAIDIAARQDFHASMHVLIHLHDLGIELRCECVCETIAPWNSDRMVVARSRRIARLGNDIDGQHETGDDASG
ncbi:MAG: hypothetical protein QOI87_2297 [Bradyrhizobium sp.]|nr:hypothetical protein [Bradyrhizobium sp.]